MTATAIVRPERVGVMGGVFVVIRVDARTLLAVSVSIFKE